MITERTERVQKKYRCFLEVMTMKSETTPHVTVTTALNILHHCLKQRFLNSTFFEYRIGLGKC